MQILPANYILTCNKNFEILQNQAICFDENIIEINDLNTLTSKYPNAKILNSKENTILMPGLINPHTHLEFSANKSILTYGGFIPWLNSVIQNRDEIMELSTQEKMKQALDEMIKSGVTTIGAISSQGLDLDVCAKSKARVVYFNEILGSNPDGVDILFEDFRHRLHVSYDKANNLLLPALSVHSPYSTHPILAKNALDIARNEHLLVSTHFMESKAERDWIDLGKGDFKEFFAPFNPHAKPFISGIEYLKLFKHNKTLFTHCVHINDEELAYMKTLNSSITHCPTSNRLLSTGLMSWQKTKDINLTLGTDGYSSNKSLNMWEELRIGLFSHVQENLQNLAKDLLKSVTCNGAKALDLNTGSLEIGKKADIVSLNLEQIPKDLTELPLHLILHVKNAKEVFVEGNNIS